MKKIERISSKEVYKSNFRQYGHMEKQRWEESEKRRAEERRSEKRKSGKKENAGARKGRKVAIHTVFSMLCGSGRSKSRLAIGAGAGPSGQMKDEKLQAVVAKHIWKSKCTKHTMLGPFLEVDTSKKCTPLWRKAHFQVNMFKIKNMFGPLLEDRMWKKCTPLWPEAHLEVKMVKAPHVGPFLDVQPHHTT